MAKPIAGSWGWHAEYGMCFINSVTRDATGTPTHYTIQTVPNMGSVVSNVVQLRHTVRASKVTILLPRDDLIALANQVHQAQGT